MKEPFQHNMLISNVRHLLLANSVLLHRKYQPSKLEKNAFNLGGPYFHPRTP